MTRALSLSKRFNLTAFFVTAFILLVVLPSLVFGQGSTPDRGFQPGGSYALSDIETVDTNNGSLMLNLALGKLAPGRGGLSGQLMLRYNSKLYDSQTQYYEDWDHVLPSGQPQIVVRDMLVTSDQGGWHYGTDYQLQLIDRMDQYPPEIAPQYPDIQTIRHYKLRVAFPDGSVHELMPRGFGSFTQDGYYDVRPDGFQTQFVNGIVQDVAALATTLTYYTFDGTYLRLEVQHDSDAYWWNNPWTLYFPDGTKVINGNRIMDRNGNYVEWTGITYNGHVATQLMDQLGRKIIIESQSLSDGEIIHVPGVGGVDLTYQVHWKTIEVFKTYSTYPLGQHNHDRDGYPELLGAQFVVSSIDLPAASGGLQYVFGYNGRDYGSAPCCSPSYGWGELSSITLPSGAQAQYKYSLDGLNGPGAQFMGTEILKNWMSEKTLTYQQQFDGTSTAVSETSQ